MGACKHGVVLFVAASLVFVSAAKPIDLIIDTVLLGLGLGLGLGLALECRLTS